ncbi:MAG: tetrathionate reductase family octaheme c-type cytochrome [Myxococcaceae bacterium]
MKQPALMFAVVLAGAGAVAWVGRPAKKPTGERLSTAIASVAVNPIAHRTRPHLDHSAFFRQPLKTGPEVTEQCLGCHPDAAQQVMETPHWSWLSGDALRDGKVVRIGKKNLMNNFCISVSGNWASCTKCHAGYGWTDANFDFTKQQNVDCLVCHDGSGTYTKDKGGLPGAKVDLAAAAGSVRTPARENCGICHFNGGGGMGVKHGDLDDSLLNANPEVDVHMGRLGFQCIDCHETHGHRVPGKLNATYSDVTKAQRFDCATCHGATPHPDAMLNKHTARVACQTCHVPEYARKYPTKMTWDWSKAGDATRTDSPHEYLKIKGEFTYEDDVRPEYAWYTGKMGRYLMGDPVTSDDLAINQPLGSRDDPNAKLWPFKVHRAKQIWDPVNKVLIPPVTSGEGGYWSKFDWAFAASKGMETAGLPYSGQYAFTQTHMYWPINHMVAPAKEAVQCKQCHGPTATRLDWQALGYPRDPAGGIRHDD